MLPRRASVDLGAMAVKGFSVFPKTPASDCFVSYTGHSWGGVLPHCWGAVSVFYSPSRLGKELFWQKLILNWTVWNRTIWIKWIAWNRNVFDNKKLLISLGPGDLGSIPGRVIPKTLKMVLDTYLLNTLQYKVRIKVKMGQSWERSSTHPYTFL